MSREVSYSLWTRRKGDAAWMFNCTPDANSAEGRLDEWAASDPEHEYRLEKTVTTTPLLILLVVRRDGWC